MQVTINRIYNCNDYCIGRMLLDNTYFCDTLEDTVREGPKVKGKTAIPPGKYQLDYNFSPHFGRKMPEILNVTGFEGIRIHWGNDEYDTEGCILVGDNTIKGKVVNSKKTFDKLDTILKYNITAKGPVFIEILNKF